MYFNVFFKCTLAAGEQFVIESDGLLVRNVRRTDAGTYTCRARFLKHLFHIYCTLVEQGFWNIYLLHLFYTCRARVPQTGELEERDIRLDVQVIIMVVIVRMIMIAMALLG